jgi:hypothetical protein
VAEYDLYIDIDRAKVVTSQTNVDSKDLPTFALGDTFGLRLHLVKNYTRASGYTIIPTTGITIQAALGVLSTGTIYCSQYSWAEEDGTSWYATFPMNTEELTTALTSQTSISATFEIKYVENGLPTTVFQESVTVYKALINPTSVMPAATPTPLSAEAAGASFVRLIETRPIYLQGANGTLIKLWNDDASGTATFKADNES